MEDWPPGAQRHGARATRGTPARVADAIACPEGPGFSHYRSLIPARRALAAQRMNEKTGHKWLAVDFLYGICSFDARSVPHDPGLVALSDFLVRISNFPS